jgi:hypothetical protein
MKQMGAVIDAFWRAAVYCLHPRVIALSFLPLIITVVTVLCLGYFFWNEAVEALRLRSSHQAGYVSSLKVRAKFRAGYGSGTGATLRHTAYWSLTLANRKSHRAGRQDAPLRIIHTSRWRIGEPPGQVVIASISMHL